MQEESKPTAAESKAGLKDLLSKRQKNRSFMRSVLDYDLFGVPVGTFTLNGKTTIKTIPGLCFSACLVILMIFFGLSRLPYLLSRKNPLLSNFHNVETFDSTK